MLLMAVLWQPNVVRGQLLDGPDETQRIFQSPQTHDSPVVESFGGQRGGWVGRSRLDLSRPPAGRHRGIAQPTRRESWLCRPLCAGSFIGMIHGGPLIDDWVSGGQGRFSGYRVGWDYHQYWGCEMRIAFGGVALCDSQRAMDSSEAVEFNRRGDCIVHLWDVSLLYYPWGDATWRPYLMAGLGTAGIEFRDRLAILYKETTFAVPVAVGLKYRCTDWLAVRLECADNIAFGDEFNTLHQLSFTGGVEFRFGGSRRAYWPWNPGRHYW